jgi:hypothetical protein
MVSAMVVGVMVSVMRGGRDRGGDDGGGRVMVSVMRGGRDGGGDDGGGNDGERDAWWA